MFSHLKAEDFVNLMEGAELPARQKSHIESCERCRATWLSVRSLHTEISSMDSDVPEPDWADFRSSVRDQLLSRSIQRESALRRWTGWAVRPAMAWALSIVFAVGMTTVTVLWKTAWGPALPAPTAVTVVPAADAADTIDAGPEKSLFDDVVSLGEEEEERFRQLLRSGETDSVFRQ
jgi:hypothetical protein